MSKPLKTPLLAVAGSAGLLVLGLSMCVPGICGCAPDVQLFPEGFESLGAILDLIGLLGLLISPVWLAMRWGLNKARREMIDERSKVAASAEDP